MKKYTICKSDMVRFIQYAQNVEWGTHAKARYFDSLDEAKKFVSDNNILNAQFQNENVK